jgi:hypothetical protein
MSKKTYENGDRLIDDAEREWTVVTSDRSTTLLARASGDASSYMRMTTGWVRKKMKPLDLRGTR